jgi:hypothetical protein
MEHEICHKNYGHTRYACENEKIIFIIYTWEGNILVHIYKTVGSMASRRGILFSFIWYI